VAIAVSELDEPVTRAEVCALGGVLRRMLARFDVDAVALEAASGLWGEFDQL
jgi:hypothetical protein